MYSIGQFSKLTGVTAKALYSTNGESVAGKTAEIAGSPIFLSTSYDPIGREPHFNACAIEDYET
jgi:hypothetical protein